MYQEGPVLDVWTRNLRAFDEDEILLLWRRGCRIYGRAQTRLAMTALNQVLRHAVELGHIDANPCDKLPRGWHVQHVMNKAQRIDDIRRWWREVDQLPIVTKTAHKLMLLSGMTCTEVRFLRRDQVVDGIAHCAGRDVPLSKWSQWQITRCNKAVKHRRYVIPAARGGAMSFLPNVASYQIRQARVEYLAVAKELATEDVHVIADEIMRRVQGAVT